MKNKLELSPRLKYSWERFRNTHAEQNKATRVVIISKTLGDNSEHDPPESISNSEVKLLRADDSVGYAHAKVGHRQAPNFKPR